MRFCELPGSIDIAWNRVNARRADDHAGLQRVQLLQPRVLLKREIVDITCVVPFVWDKRSR